MEQKQQALTQTIEIHMVTIFFKKKMDNVLYGGQERCNPHIPISPTNKFRICSYLAFVMQLAKFYHFKIKLSLALT